MAQFIDIITSDTQKIVEKQGKMAAKLLDLKISSQEEYNQAGEKLKDVKGALKQLEDLRKSITAPLDNSKKTVMDFFRTPIEKLLSAESWIKRGMLSYQQQEEEKRRAEERRLAELQRKEAEKLAEKAEKMEAKGRTEKAEELRAQAEEVEAIVPVVAPTIEKVAGIKTMTIWKFEIIDAGKIERQFLIPDEKKIGATVRATKGTLEIKGVRVYSEEVMAV